MKPILKLTAVCAALLCGTAHAYDVTEKSISQLQADLQARRVTSVELVRLYEARIAALNPKLHAVISINPAALAQAKAADAARNAHAPHTPLAGIPILLKDNIESADPIATTAGSLALAGNVGGRDAPLVARLRAAGAINLGKANLSEWPTSVRAIRSAAGARLLVRHATLMRSIATPVALVPAQTLRVLPVSLRRLLGPRPMDR